MERWQISDTPSILHPNIFSMHAKILLFSEQKPCPMPVQTCGQMSEDKVKLVVGPDGRPTGEAYVEISGAGAKLRLALAKDRQIMPGSSRYIEIFTSTRDEVDRRALTGVMLV